MKPVKEDEAETNERMYTWNLLNRLITFAISSIITSCVWVCERNGCKSKAAVEWRKREPTYLFCFIDLLYPFPNKNKEANVEFIFIFGVKIKPFFLFSNCADRSHGNGFIGVHMEWGECWPAPVIQPKDTECTEYTHTQTYIEKKMYVDAVQT